MRLPIRSVRQRAARCARRSTGRAAALALLLALTPVPGGASVVRGQGAAPSPAPATAVNPTAAVQAVQQALALMGQGRFAEAIALLEPVTQQQPQNGQAWYLLAAALHGAGQLERAIDLHAKAAAFPEVRANALYNLACAHARLGHADEAFAQLAAARAAGFADDGQLLVDTDLVPLHDDARWAKLVRAAADAPAFAEDVVVLQLWRGEAANGLFGWEALDAGDVDGDGVHDVLTSAPFLRGLTPEADPNALPGRVYVYSAKSGALLFSRTGEGGEQLGLGLSALGDVNGDGTPDVLVGAPWPGVPAAGTPAGAPAQPSPHPGRAYVLSGRDGAVLLTVTGAAPDDAFGNQVRGLGDVDGDGVPDFAVAAPQHDVGGALADAGRVGVFSGRDGAPLCVLDGQAAGDRFGSALGGGDGLLIVGAMDAGAGRRGRVYVYRLRRGGAGGTGVSGAADGAGAAAPPRAAAGVSAEDFFVIEAEPSGAGLGQFFVSVAGDLDADGAPDIYAADFTDSVQAGGAGGGPRTPGGRVLLHSGADGRRLASVPAPVAGEGFGIGRAAAGDVNRDGHDDLVIGAWTNSERAPRAGKAYVLSGKDRSTLATFTGLRAREEFGYDAIGLGDVNGDGALDFLITAASANDGAPRAGRVYVLSGAGIAGALTPAPGLPDPEPPGPGPEAPGREAPR